MKERGRPRRLIAFCSGGWHFFEGPANQLAEEGIRAPFPAFTNWPCRAWHSPIELWSGPFSWAIVGTKQMSIPRKFAGRPVPSREGGASRYLRQAEHCLSIL